MRIKELPKKMGEPSSYLILQYSVGIYNVVWKIEVRSMSQKTVHPSIQKFKEFVKKHPKLATEVKSKKKTWQELFEDWYLLGEDDPIWNQYKDDQEKKKDNQEKADFMSTILTAVKGIDLAQVEHHMSTVGDALTTIHQIISQFKGTDENNKSKQSNHPFFFSKD